MLSRPLQIAISTAKEAGRLIIEYFGTTQKSYKSDQSIVTKADLESDKLIKQILLEEFPDHSVLSEESGEYIQDSDHLWVVDPLDGTTNFSVKNPFFAVSIAYCFRNTAIVGVVYAPILKELFIAEKGQKVTLNGAPIRVNSDLSLEKAFISFENGRDETSRHHMALIYSRLKPMNNKIRQVGAVSLDMSNVAVGRFGAFLMPGINAWDVAAGGLIVEEAGGIVTDFQNRPFRTTSTNILAATPSLHTQLCEIINDCN